MKGLILIIAIALAGPNAFAQGKSNHNKGGGGNTNKKTGNTNVQKNAPNVGKINKGNVNKNQGTKVDIVIGKNKGNPGNGNSGNNKHGNSTTVYGHPNKNGNGKPSGMSGYEHGKATSNYNKNKHKIPQTQGIALSEILKAHERTGALFTLHVSKLDLLKNTLENKRRLGTISDIEYRRKKASINLLESRHKSLKVKLK